MLPSETNTRSYSRQKEGTALYPHYVIDGRIYRIVSLEAADTRAARNHISSERPISATTAKEIREAVTQ